MSQPDWRLSRPAAPKVSFASYSPRWLTFAAPIGLLALLRAPFLLTDHIQEDAYISFRTAFNLADHGSLTFNLGEHYASTTSLLYGYFVATVRLLTGRFAILAVLTANALAAATAVLVAGRSLALEGRLLWLFALLVGLSNGALIPAFNGMETSWYLLYLCLLLSRVGRAGRSAWPLVALIVVAPLVRPDAIGPAMGAAALNWLFAWKEGSSGPESTRSQMRWALAGAVAAMALYVALNLYHSGTWATPSVIAKQAAYHPELSIGALAQRFGRVYFGGLLSLLPSTKYLPWPVIAVISAFSFGVVLASIGRLRRVMSPEVFLRYGYLLFLALVFPLFFVVSGAMFPWYFYPSSFALAACLFASAATLPATRPRGAVLAAGTLFITATALLQFLLSVNVGRQEHGYRADVGRFLASVSRPGDTLVLEPAGYIPFYSGLTTYDEVGLTSPRVLPYLRSRQANWIANFLRDTCPTFTVQPGDFGREFASEGYRFQPSEKRWFSAHYQLLRQFSYRPEDYASSPLERRVLRWGSHSDYAVYRRRAPNCD